MLINEQIKLRAVEPTDVNFLFEMENNTDAWKVSDTVVPFSRSTLQKYAESFHDLISQGQFRFVIESVNGSERLGMIDLFDYSPMHHRSGVGIVIAAEYRENGLASEALSLLIEYATKVLSLKQIHCSIHASNASSIRLFEKHGFTKVGVRKDWYKTSNGWEDECLFQLLLTEL